MVCLFTSQLSLVLTAPTHLGTNLDQHNFIEKKNDITMRPSWQRACRQQSETMQQCAKAIIHNDHKSPVVSPNVEGIVVDQVLD